MLAIAVGMCCVATVPSRAQAALDAAQKKELAAIRSELSRIRTPIQPKAIDDAEQKTSDAEKRLETWIGETGLSDNDSRVAAIRKLIAARRRAIAKAREKEEQKKGARSDATGSPKGKGTSKGKSADRTAGFVAQVAPIIAKHCLSCHGKEAKGGLRLDTFAGMEKGGKSGPLLVIGDAENSLVMARLTAQGDARMPKGGEPLSEAECLKIAEWINRGARFDGEDREKPLDKLSSTADRPRRKVGKIVVARPTGGETVSFTKDIAPFMVERCLRCHSGNDPKSELSLETFESLLAGGKRGPEITPGSLEKSRLWDLVGNQQPFKMPPGDAFIKRSHWNSLRTWILEGAKYDGGDPKRPLRSLVPTESEQLAAKIASTTPAEMHDKRRQRSEEAWRRAFPKQPPERIEGDSFLVYGNVTAERLREVDRWATAGMHSVEAFFDDHASPVFKGGLSVFVLKDRASYEEFSQSVENREPQPAVRGHAVVTPDLEDAYVVIQDVPAGEAAVGETRKNLVEQLTAAFLMRCDKKIPDWLVVGSGRVLTAAKPGAVLPKSQWPAVHRLVGSLEKREDLLVDGTFSPSAGRDVGAALVAFLLEARGKPSFVRFVKSLRNGTAQADAFRDVYGVEPRRVADDFLAHAAQAASQTAE